MSDSSSASYYDYDSSSSQSSSDDSSSLDFEHQEVRSISSSSSECDNRRQRVRRTRQVRVQVPQTPKTDRTEQQPPQTPQVSQREAQQLPRTPQVPQQGQRQAQQQMPRTPCQTTSQVPPMRLRPLMFPLVPPPPRVQCRVDTFYVPYNIPRIVGANMSPNTEYRQQSVLPNGDILAYRVEPVILHPVASFVYPSAIQLQQPKFPKPTETKEVHKKENKPSKKDDRKPPKSGMKQH